MDNEKFGKFIQKLRKEKNMTQKQLGEKLNITDKAISKWERGLSFPDISMLNSIGETFDITVTELLNCEIGVKNEIDVEKAIQEAVEKITKSQEKKKNKLKKLKKVSSIISVIIFICCLITQLVYLFVLKPRNYEYVLDILYYIINELIIITATLISILIIKKSKIKNIITYILFAILTIINLVFMFNTGLNNKCILSFSSNFSNGLVLKQNKETGLTTLYNPKVFLFATPKEELPQTIEGSIKHQWITKDTCSLTYKDKNNITREFVVTYGSREGQSSYYHIASSFLGTWNQSELTEGPSKIYVDSKGITICEDDENILFEYDDCIQYGITTLVLYKNDIPKYVLTMNDDCIIDDETTLIKNGGTIALCEVSMQKTIVKQFKCATFKNDDDLKNYKLVNVQANDYVIQNGILYISYDGNEAVEVPGDFSNMEDSYTDYNYQISSEKTVFFYTSDNKRYLVYCDNMSNIWNTVEIDSSTSIQNIHFINKDVGFMFEIEDTAMGIAFGKISKSTDGGRNWVQISRGIMQGDKEIFKTSSQIKFVDENTGFLTMPATSGESCELYMTSDSGKTFSKLDIIQSDIYDYYNLPVSENGKLYLEISQGSDGDYNGNDSQNYISADNGVTWNLSTGQ